MQRKSHPNSLANLKLGGASRKKGKIKLNLTVVPDVAATLKKSGNASRFVELLVQAYEQKKILTPQEILYGELTPDLDYRQ